MEKLDKINYRLYPVLPSVYDDTLSFYELLGKMNNLLNGAVDDINDIIDTIQPQTEFVLSVNNVTADANRNVALTPLNLGFTLDNVNDLNDITQICTCRYNENSAHAPTTAQGVCFTAYFSSARAIQFAMPQGLNTLYTRIHWSGWSAWANLSEKDTFHANDSYPMQGQYLGVVNSAGTSFAFTVHLPKKLPSSLTISNNLVINWVRGGGAKTYTGTVGSITRLTDYEVSVQINLTDFDGTAFDVLAVNFSSGSLTFT